MTGAGGTGVATGEASPILGGVQSESLYDWMRRNESVDFPKTGTEDEDRYSSSIPDEPREPGPKSTPQTKSMHLLDAHIIFEPLLSSLGLMPQQIQNLSLKNLGSNVSVLASVDVFKIDIVESEYHAGRHRSHNKGSHRRIRVPVMDSSASDPSFLCEKMLLQVDFKKSD